MREILFRGKRDRDWKKHKTGEWVMGCLWHYTNKSAIIYSDELDDKVWVFADTVGQFTGMTDKNGTKIFEGDILRSANIFVVGFEDGSFVLRFGEDGSEYAHDHFLDEMLVIGNIHDNPELLEKGGT